MSAEKKSNKDEPKTDERIRIRPLNKLKYACTIEGITPLLIRRFGQDAKEGIREGQQAGGKRKVREARDIQHEYEEAFHKLSDGSNGFPAPTIKNCIAAAAHKDLGVPKTDVKKAVFLEHDEWLPECPPLIRIQHQEAPKMREDMVRIGRGMTSLVYRPEFMPWSIDLRMELDGDILNPETLLNLIERSGWGVGVGEWRPERGGEFGRFQIKRN